MGKYKIIFRDSKATPIETHGGSIPCIVIMLAKRAKNQYIKLIAVYDHDEIDVIRKANSVVKNHWRVLLEPEHLN